MTEADRATTLFDFRAKRVYVAGHNGMVGSAIVRRLKSEACEILTVDQATLDLTRQDETERWIGSAKPDAVIVSAAKVGELLSTVPFRLTSWRTILPSRSTLLAPRTRPA